ncbi:MAG: hypothetical protein HPY79_05890 [Bacteroidales bacterium]|nr:hypothetical protein [Bacteroidales bacterium]
MKSFFSKILKRTGKTQANHKETTHYSTSIKTPKHPGHVKVNAFFLICQTSQDKKIKIIKKESMGSINIPILSTDDDAEIIWKAVKEITSNLLENYLNKEGILQFIPFHRPTYDWKNEILEAGSEMEVYYYHSKDFYEQKFKLYNEGYIKQINDPNVLKKLEDLCKFYNLDPANYL